MVCSSLFRIKKNQQTLFSSSFSACKTVVIGYVEQKQSNELGNLEKLRFVFRKFNIFFIMDSMTQQTICYNDFQYQKMKKNKRKIQLFTAEWPVEFGDMRDI